MINESTNRLGPTGISIYSGLAGHTFVNKQMEATAAYSEAQTKAIHNIPTPPLLL